MQRKHEKNSLSLWVLYSPLVQHQYLHIRVTDGTPFMNMLVSTAGKLLHPYLRSVQRRSIADLPKYDEASKIGMRKLWPAVLVLVGLHALAFSVSPFRTSSMDPHKWTRKDQWEFVLCRVNSATIRSSSSIWHFLMHFLSVWPPNWYFSWHSWPTKHKFNILG